MESEHPNRLGPVTRAEYAALERRIEQLERRVGGAAEKTPREQFGWVIESELSPHSGPEYFTGCFTTRAMVWSNPGDHLAAIRFARKEDAEKVARQLSPFNNKHRVCEHAWIDSQPFAGMKRPVTGGDGGNSQCATSPSQAGVSEPSATVHLVKRSPENAAAYWREQWEKMHAEVVSLRVESHEWKTKYESQCRGVKSYLEQIDSLRAQLAARPVVTATDEQVKALVHDICSGEWHPAVAQSIRSWLSTLGVVQTKQVEAWVAGDRLPLNGEVYALPTSAVLRCATFHHEEPSKARVLVRKTLNVVQEPNNANPV